MNHRRFPLLVRIEAATQAADELDGVPEVWTVVGSAWGDIRPMGGREYSDGDTMVGEVTHKVTTRYVEDATPRQRLLVAGKRYEVESVYNVDNRNRWTEWRVREVV